MGNSVTTSSSVGNTNDIAIFLDLDNLVIGAKQANLTFDINLILEHIKQMTNGRIVLRRSYGDWRQNQQLMKELPAVKAAAVPIYGDMCEFPHILKAYDAAYDWIRENGYEIAESPREIWWSEPGSDAHMEVVWPFREP